MAAKINHGALDTLYGIIVQHADGSWSPYSQMGTRYRDGESEAGLREFVGSIYGGEVPARVVRFVARVLCDNPTCEGHDSPDDSCTPSACACSTGCTACDPL